MNYTKTRANAQHAIARAGQPVTLTCLSDGVYDPETGKVTRTGTTHTGYGAPVNYAQRDIDGTMILRSDVRVLLGPQIGVTPTTGDTLTVAGEVYTVIASNPLAPGGIVVLHDVQCRKA